MSLHTLSTGQMLDELLAQGLALGEATELWRRVPNPRRDELIDELLQMAASALAIRKEITKLDEQISNFTERLKQAARKPHRPRLKVVKHT